MIALRVYGEGRKWLGQVVAVAATDADDWSPVKGPLKSSRSAEGAAAAAIKAWNRGQRPAITCERCRHTWHVQPRNVAAGIVPRRCPACKNPWRYEKRERALTETEQLLRDVTGRGPEEAPAAFRRRRKPTP